MTDLTSAAPQPGHINKVTFESEIIIQDIDILGMNTPEEVKEEKKEPEKKIPLHRREGWIFMHRTRPKKEIVYYNYKISDELKAKIALEILDSCGDVEYQISDIKIEITEK